MTSHKQETPKLSNRHPEYAFLVELIKKRLECEDFDAEEIPLLKTAQNALTLMCFKPKYEKLLRFFMDEVAKGWKP